MEQLDLTYTNIWAICLTSLVFYTAYERGRYDHLVKKEGRREYYPLNFKSATVYQFVKVNEQHDETVPDPCVYKSAINQGGFEVIDQYGLVKFKFVKGRATLLSEEWKMFEIQSDSHSELLTTKDEDYVSLIHMNPTWSIFNKDIYFPLRKNKRYEEQMSAGVGAGSALSPLSQPVSACLSNDNYTSPYIEPAILANAYVKRRQLCNEMEYNPHPTLHIREERRVSRIHVKHYHKYKSGFRVLKNSDFEYFWCPNGYLEKTMVQKDEYATERIGHMKAEKSHVKLYINEKMIEPEMALSSCFLQYILNYQ